MNFVNNRNNFEANITKSSGQLMVPLRAIGIIVNSPY